MTELECNFTQIVYERNASVSELRELKRKFELEKDLQMATSASQLRVHLEPASAYLAPTENEMEGVELSVPGFDIGQSVEEVDCKENKGEKVQKITKDEMSTVNDKSKNGELDDAKNEVVGTGPEDEKKILAKEMVKS